MTQAEQSVRLDQWLWAARFFKTRPLAVSAIKNGRVDVNGQRAKPARNVSAGDVIHIRKQAELEFTVTVTDVSSKRVSATVAQNLYEESAESIERRENLREQQQIARNMVDFPDKRPDKRARRNIRAIKHQE